MTRVVRGGLVLVGVLVLMLGGLREATADPCKADGEVCRTSRSCCGTSGNNGVCVKAGGAKFGVCCTLTGSEVCDGRDNDCNGSVDEGLGTTTCGVGACAHMVQNCVGGVPQTCDPAATNGTECDDNDACTEPDTCQDGACTGEPVRFVDNGDGTVSDCQTGLMWEKKGEKGDLHNVNFFYSWAGICPDFSLCQPSAGAAAACAAGAVGTTGCAECASGTCNPDPFLIFDTPTTIWDWLATVNAEGGTGFAGHSDWRIPEVNRDGGSAELETILAAPCSSAPCVGPAFNRCTYDCSVLTCSCTSASVYWSSVTSANNPERAWGVYFGSADVMLNGNKGLRGRVRAVRGGS